MSVRSSCPIEKMCLEGCTIAYLDGDPDLLLELSEFGMDTRSAILYGR